MQISPKDKKLYLIGGAVGLALVGWIYLHNKSQAAATTTADQNIDPATGFPYGSAEDQAALASQGNYSNIDPSTGYPYGTSQDAQALQGIYGSGGGTTTGYVPPSGGTTTVTTNAQWVAEVVAGLSASGYNSETVSGALGAYLAGMPLSESQLAIIQVALAEFGPPPGGQPSVNAGGGAGAGSGGGAGAPAPSGGPISVTPVNLHVTNVYTTAAQVAWLAPRIPTGQGPLTGYSVEAFDSSGHLVNGPFKVGTGQLYANIGGLKTKTSYHVNVWCDPAKTGGPHATVSFTTK